MEQINQQTTTVPTETLAGVVELCDALKKENDEMKRKEARRTARRNQSASDGTPRQDAIIWVNAQIKKAERKMDFDRKQYARWRSLRARGVEGAPFQPSTPLKSVDLKVAARIRNAICPEGHHANIRQDTIAKELKVSTRTIQRSAVRLESEGIFFRQRQHQKNNRSRFSHYCYIPALGRQKSDVLPAYPPATESGPLVKDLSNIKESSICKSTQARDAERVPADSPRHKPHIETAGSDEIPCHEEEITHCHVEPPTPELTPTPQEPIHLHPGREKQINSPLQTDQAEEPEICPQRGGFEEEGPSQEDERDRYSWPGRDKSPLLNRRRLYVLDLTDAPGIVRIPKHRILH